MMRFMKRIRLFPGIRLNLGKRGASVSVGPRGLTTTLGSSGIRQTVGGPGTGLSWSRKIKVAETEGAAVKRLIERGAPLIMDAAATEGRLQEAFEENVRDARAAILRAGGERMLNLIDSIDANTSEDVSRGDIESAFVGVAADWIKAHVIFRADSHQGEGRIPE